MENAFQEEVFIPMGSSNLMGDLFIPAGAAAVIIFSHGSGSSRFSPRNRQVAASLHEKNLGTLLLDLLTPEEENDYKNRFNIGLLTKRLAGATQWLEKHPAARNCRIGYFGASTGAASALQAAALLPQISAVVSRGGRPDLASLQAIHRVAAPVLLIVGSLDHDVLQLNRNILRELRGDKELIVVNGASHLFEESGKLEKVAALAGNWFEKYLKPVTIEK